MRARVHEAPSALCMIESPAALLLVQFLLPLFFSLSDEMGVSGAADVSVP